MRLVERLFTLVHGGCRDPARDQLVPLFRSEEAAKITQRLAVAPLRHGVSAVLCGSSWLRTSEQDLVLVLGRVALWRPVAGDTRQAARCVSSRTCGRAGLGS
jgi:hypothetical protein